MLNEPTKPKKTIHASEIIARLYIIERDQKETDINIKKWADGLLLNEHLKLINKLSKGAFDISSKSKQIVTYFHCIKILLKIDPTLVASQLLTVEDLEIQLITYVRDTEKEKICQDAIFILASIFSNANEFKDLFTQDFLMGLFDLLDIIEDDFNFRAAVKILIEINSVYSTLKSNIFLKVYHIHPNARIFNEVLIRLINVEEEPNKMIKMFLCLSNIFDKEQDNILYSTDLESFIDIIILKLQSAYTEELKTFIIDMMERITQYPEYYKRMYKIEEISNLFDDFANNDTETEVVKLKAKKVVDTLSQSISEMNKENIKSSKDNIGNYQDEKKNYKLVESDLKKEIIV